MKIKDGFILRSVAGTNLVVAVGEQSKTFNKVVKLNDTAAFLWRQLENECTFEQLTERLTQEYEVSQEVAEYDTRAFINTLKEASVLD